MIDKVYTMEAPEGILTHSVVNCMGRAYLIKSKLKNKQKWTDSYEHPIFTIVGLSNAYAHYPNDSTCIDSQYILDVVKAAPALHECVKILQAAYDGVPSSFITDAQREYISTVLSTIRRTETTTEFEDITL